MTTTRRRTTAPATSGVRCNSANPPRLSMSRISSVAYALEERGSEQKTGSAIRLGRRVWPMCSLRSGVPTRRRFGRVRTLVTSPVNDRAEWPAGTLMASIRRARRS